VEAERLREPRRAACVHLRLDPAPPRRAALHGVSGSTQG
jgi:hypothetical protein